jgi:hypothetical protein
MHEGDNPIYSYKDIHDLERSEVLLDDVLVGGQGDVLDAERMDLVPDRSVSRMLTMHAWTCPVPGQDLISKGQMTVSLLICQLCVPKVPRAVWLAVRKGSCWCCRIM